MFFCNGRVARRPNRVCIRRKRRYPDQQVGPCQASGGLPLAGVSQDGHFTAPRHLYAHSLAEIACNMAPLLRFKPKCAFGSKELPHSLWTGSRRTLKSSRRRLEDSQSAALPRARSHCGESIGVVGLEPAVLR